jgi:GDP-L-fucose synthase
MKTILVTGGSGLVGNAIKTLEKEFVNYNFLFLNSKICDLTKYNELIILFNTIKPDIIIHLAACVGGLFKNISQKVKMFEDNILINTHVIKAANAVGVKDLIACLSTCVFPDKTEYPIDETMLNNGPPHHSNEGYAYSKRMMELHCKLYNETYGTNYICIIPTNIYGPHDNFSLEDGHVIPSLIHKCYLAKKEGIPFEVKGSGRPLRQFIYSMDLAKLIMLILENNELIGTGVGNIILSPVEEYSIREVAELINSHFGNEIVFNQSYSDGQYRKTADNSKLKKLLKKVNFEFTDLKDGISQSVNFFITNRDNLRT